MENQTVQNPTPEPTLTPIQASKPKTKFPVMYLVLSLLIIVLLASTVFLYYQNMQLKKMLASYQNSASPTPTTYQSPVPTTDPTANWKTYTNQRYNFSIKYPPSYTLSDNLPNTPNEWRPEKTLTIKNEGIPETPTLLLEINFDGYGPIPYTKEYALELTSEGLKILSKKNLDTSSIIEMTGEPISTTHITTNILERGGNIFHFQLIIQDLSNEGLEKELDQILSTFKFTN